METIEKNSELCEENAEVIEDCEDSLIDSEEISVLKDQIDKLNQEIGDLKDNQMRTLAEFDNFRKRSHKEKNECYDNAIAQSVKAFLDVLDNLERALDSFEEDNNLKSGVELTLNQFKTSLKSLGVEEIASIGQEFNPDFHDAVSTVKDDKFGDNEICEVLRKGYILKDRVLRHAMVCVANI